MNPLKRNSIRKIVYITATVIIALLLISAIVNLLLVRSHYQNYENQQIHEQVKNKALIIGRQLKIYKQVIANVAAEPNTRDLLLFGDNNAAHNWAVEMRKYLPQSIGVALLSKNGEVLGDPVTLRLGPQCMTDLTRLSQGENVAHPPIHRDIPELSHYDLTTPVFDEENQQMGILFVSFSLDTLKAVLQESVSKEQLLQLLDTDGEPIAVAGAISTSREQYSVAMPVPDSSWTIKVTENLASSSPIYLTLSLSNVLTSALVIALIIFFIAYVSRTVKHDFETVKKRLNQVSEGEFNEEAPNIQLKESAEILPSIEYIARDIQKKQQMIANQSWVDDLTGLPNRRHFNNEFVRAYNLARRGIPMAVVLIDLDNFKKLNSQAGKTAGDQALKLFANTLQQYCRKTDFAARLGGDEFALLLLDMQPDKIRPCLEKLSETFLEQQERHPAVPDELRCTISCGYTFINVHRDYNAAAVLTRADKTLDAAKAQGKNCVVEA
ncbi:MAG: sensor domain-containing diguanylate cyclase [Gammaproteobacteria bacterium]|nr:sensor domain-containing diguanylate cyclase [Gammaproteobacteria bacterium]